MKKYGVVLNESTVKQEAMNMGMYSGKGNLDASIKAQAAFNLVLKGTTAAQGDTIRTQDSFANIQKRLSASLEDQAAELGTLLIPSFQNLGLAMLGSAENGSAFTSMLAGVSEAIGVVVNGLAGIIEIFNLVQSLGKESGAESAAVKSQERLNEQLKQSAIYIKNVSGLTVKGEKDTVAFLNARAKYGDKTAEMMLKSISQEQAIIKKTSSDVNKYQTDQIDIQRRLSELGGKTEKSIDKAKTANKDLTEDAKKNYTKQLEAYKKLQSDIASETASGSKKVIQTNTQMFNSYVGAFQGVIGQLSAISQAYSQNQLDRLEQERERRLEILEERRERELELKGIKEEESESEAETEYANLKAQLAAAQSAQDKADLKARLKKAKNSVDLEKIDAKYAKEKERIEAELDEKKKKIEYEAAKRKKVTDVIQSVMNTALGVTNAFANVPAPANVPFAAVVGSLGAAQTALIMAQPLPQYAAGGVSDVPAIFGEAGRELAIPLTGNKGQSAIAELSNGLLDQIGQRTEGGAFAEVAGETVSQIIEINIDGENIEKIVQNGLDNRRIYV